MVAGIWDGVVRLSVGGRVLENERGSSLVGRGAGEPRDPRVLARARVRRIHVGAIELDGLLDEASGGLGVLCDLSFDHTQEGGRDE